MPLVWSNLKEYRCPLCGESLKERQEKHCCSECNFCISDQKLSNLTVIRHRKLEPPEFIKEIRSKNKESIFKKMWKTMWKTKTNI
jgi:hypothetical protein